MSVAPITTVPGLTPPASTGAAAATPGAGFGSALQDLLGAVDQSTGTANDAIANMVDGTGDAHEAMIALQRADMMLQLTVQIRNKLVQAYQDLMRMPV